MASARSKEACLIAPDETCAEPTNSATTLLVANRTWPCWKYICRTSGPLVRVRIPVAFCRSSCTKMAAAGLSERSPSTTVGTPCTLHAFTSASRSCARSNGFAKYASGRSSRIRSGLGCLYMPLTTMIAVFAPHGRLRRNCPTRNPSNSTRLRSRTTAAKGSPDCAARSSMSVASVPEAVEEAESPTSAQREATSRDAIGSSSTMRTFCATSASPRRAPLSHLEIEGQRGAQRARFADEREDTRRPLGDFAELGRKELHVGSQPRLRPAAIVDGHILVRSEARPHLRLPERVGETTHAIDQPAFQGLRSRPDAPAADRVYLCRTQLAALRHPIHELLVEGLHPALHHLALGIAERTSGAEQIGALAPLVRHQGEAEATIERVQIELSDEHADRPGDRRWFGIDPVGGYRYVVSAGGGDVAHAGDDRLLLLLSRTNELAPDEIGRGAVSAGRIDAHDDGADTGIVGERVDAPRDGVGARDLHAAERRGAARAARDVALDAHDGDARPRSPSVVADRRWIEGRLAQEHGAAAEQFPNLLLELVGIHQRIHQSRPQRLLRSEESSIEEAPEVPFIDVSPARHLAHVASEHVVEQGVRDFALLFRHVAAGEDVRRVLVRADTDELRLHAELFEARAGEERRRGKAVHRQDGLRGHEDPVGYRGDSIVQVTAGFQVKDDLLPGALQSFDSGSQFFGASAAERQPSRP